MNSYYTQKLKEAETALLKEQLRRIQLETKLLKASNDVIENKLGRKDQIIFKEGKTYAVQFDSHGDIFAYKEVPPSAETLQQEADSRAERDI